MSDTCSQVFIGGWRKTKCAIRRNNVYPTKAEIGTPNILSDAEYRGFWISWADGLVEDGREGEMTPILKWQDPELFDVRYYGIRTKCETPGSWFIGEWFEYVN